MTVAVVRSDQIVHKSNRTKNKSDALDLIVGIIHVAMDLGRGGALEYSKDNTDQLKKYISEITVSEWPEWDLSELSKIQHLKLCVEETAYYLHSLCLEEVWTGKTVDRAAIFTCLLIDTMNSALLEEKAESLPKDLHASKYLAKCRSAAMKKSFELFTVNNQIVESLSKLMDPNATMWSNASAEHKALLLAAFCQVNEFRARPDLKKHTSFIQRVAKCVFFHKMTQDDLEKKRKLMAAADAIVKYCDPASYAKIRPDADREKRSRIIAPVISKKWILLLFATVKARVEETLKEESYQVDTQKLIEWFIAQATEPISDLCMQRNNASTESESQNNNSDISSQSGAAGETDSQSA